MTADSAKKTWSSALPEELRFWEYWLTTDDAEVAQSRENRLRARERPLLERLATSASGEEQVRVLDVGAGPLTTLGMLVNGHTAEVVAVDPLANQYKELLERAGIKPPIPTIYGEGEKLVSQFGESSFHGIYCANALDHCYSPMQVFRQMASVVKPRGMVEVLCFNNVGEMEQYQGLHQWNITIRDERPTIWNKSTEIDVGSELEGLATAKGEINDTNLVVIQIQKTAAS